MSTERSSRALPTSIASIVVGLVVGGAVFGGLTAFTPTPAHADASSAVTVTAASQDSDVANAPAPDLAVTVSQTKDLISQGIVVSWTGGKQSTPQSQQTGGENFLQIMQCGGDDPANPGQPDRTTCQYGAFLSPGAKRDAFRVDGTIAPEDQQYTAPRAGAFTPAYTAIPYLGSDGESVAAVVDGKRVDPAVDVNTNRYFSLYTSNEIPWAGTGSDGTGSSKFEVQTTVQAPGLGCGSQVTAADGTTAGKSCWLVVIPRGTADSGEPNITGSGLFWDAWKHRIAIKLDFRPIGINCAIGTAEQHLSGSELLATAVASWQPKLCGTEGGDAYTLITGAESDAAGDANGTIPGPLALTSRALRPDPDSGETDQLKYAPIGLTGLSISFAIDRSPKADPSVPDDAQGRAHLPFTSMKLTPRLVAKLLTGSYLDALPYQADRSHLAHKANGALVYNPRNLLSDPDFLAINDKEWQYQAIASPGIADLIVPQGRSDAAYQLWSYVLGDKDAAAFLAGTADPWGMTVNPWTSTNAKINPTGSAMQYPRDDFPKADPTEQPAVTNGPAAINQVTWRPYTSDLDTAGYLTLRGDGQVLGGWDPLGRPAKYTKPVRDLAGTQKVLAVTDTAAAAKYQVVTAALQNPAGQFVTASTDSLTAAAAAMTNTKAQPQVYGFDYASASAKSAASAYPLAMPVYAAMNPAMTDDALRASYATFIRFAADAGQTPGPDLGQLPAGYAPIPAGWKAQALAAADAIQTGAAPTTPPATTPTDDGQGAAPAGTGGGYTGGGSTGAGTGGDAPVVPGENQPAAQGATAAALSAGRTPSDAAAGPVQFAIPISLAAGALGAVAVPLMPRLRRRL